MQTTDGFAGLDCLDCPATFDAAETTHHCPECGGPLTSVYDSDHLSRVHDRLESGAVERSAVGGIGRFAELLPFEASAMTTLGEGMTPVIDCPELAETVGVERVQIKDEASSTTGAVADRGLALAVTAASQHEASDVALPTTGNGGQAAAAYAARAGIESHSYVPTRSTFANKAMINVHGGDMNVVGGRYPDAVSAFEDRNEEWYSLAPFETPYRHEGQKTIAYELFTGLDTLPDAIVHPTGHGTVLFGLCRGFLELKETGAIDKLPRLYAAQAAGCAPIVSAHEAGKSEPAGIESPDTISGPLEIPKPAGGRYVLEVIDETGGGAVTVTDDELLEAAVSLAQAGVPASATGGVAAHGTKKLAEDGEFDSDEQLLLINPTTANRESDILRSHLMSQGI